jgi:cytochrome c556
MRAIIALLMLLCVACSQSQPDSDKQVAALKAEIDALKAAQAATKSSEPPELGQQMLELQIRHARLWQAGEAQNWLLTQFQIAELREALAGVAEQNGDHAALQPQRLADVLPGMTNPALKQLQDAADAQDKAKFEAAYDALSNACTACHVAADHGFLVIQRPRTPVLDNLRAE